MTAVAATMTLEGTAPILAKFGGMAERLAHPEPVLNVVADLLEAHVAATFATTGGRVGRPWTPLAPRTVRARARRWGYYRIVAPGAGAAAGGPALRWSGRLAGSFRRGGVDHVREISATTLRWGSEDPRAKFHQSSGPRTHLPRRPPLAFRDAFQQREIVFQPLRLYLQGVPVGAIATVMRARLGL